MYIEYLRHNKIFKRIFAMPLRLRARWLSRHRKRFTDIYDRVVKSGTLVVSPDNIDGMFEIAARSDIARRILWDGLYEETVTKVLDGLKIENGLIVNIGANIGLFSIYLAQKKRQAVLAIEPNPEAYSLLLKNIKMNGCEDSVRVENVCIGNSVGEVDFAVIDGRSEYSSIGKIVHPSVADLKQRIIKVPIKPLNALTGSEKVSLMFIDTEGAEAMVFQGGAEVIKRDKPVLFFECSNLLLRKFDSSSEDIDKLLQSFGYVVTNAFAPNMTIKHPFDGEILAIHKSLL